ncbi:23579_t:CDS:2, partial [Dentiscutata erythropus]
MAKQSKEEKDLLQFEVDLTLQVENIQDIFERPIEIAKQYISPSFHNLWKITITTTQYHILNYKHKFIPTSTPTQRKGLTDMDQPYLTESLTYLERRFNLFFEFGGGGSKKSRPIVGMYSAPIKRLSVFLLVILKDWMTSLEQYFNVNWIPLRDNFQLIYQVEKIKNQFNYVVTGNFEFLYTKFTHPEILSAFDYLNNHTIPIKSYFGFNKPKIRFILALVIDNNYFKALGKIYKQKRGIAMGTNTAVHIAQLTCFAHELVAINNRLFNNIFY